MKILLLGASGQLGSELQRTCPDDVILISCEFPGVDFCSPDSIRQCIQTAQPDCIINAAGYTAVDKAEQEPDLADRINHLAIRHIAELCRQNQIRLGHISTDFNFSGRHVKPYQPDDIPGPESVYSKSKLKGEQAIRDTLENALIIRTAWLYSIHGHNFVITMLRLIKEKTELRVIEDQLGSPIRPCQSDMDSSQTQRNRHFFTGPMPGWHPGMIAVWQTRKRVSAPGFWIRLSRFCRFRPMPTQPRPNGLITTCWTKQLPSKHWVYSLFTGGFNFVP